MQPNSTAAAAIPATAKLAALHGAVESRAAPLKEIEWAKSRLEWMAANSIWPWGKNARYTWTDAFGVVLLVSLYAHTGDAKWLNQAEDVAADVWKVLGDARCLRIGLEPYEDRFPYSYAHYNAMWLYALHCLHKANPTGGHHDKAIDMVKATHPCFIVPGRGVLWKIKADGSGTAPGHAGFGGLDPFKLFAVYRLLDPTGEQIGREIGDLRTIVENQASSFECSQDLGLGMMLWVCHFFLSEPWAKTITARCLATLDGMWVDKGSAGGYFARAPWARGTCLAFSNYGVSIGLQSVGAMGDRVVALNRYLQGYKHPGDLSEYDAKAITWVMACNSHFPGWLVDTE